MPKYYFSIVILLILCFSFTFLTSASAHSSQKPILIVVKTMHDHPHLPQQEMSISCKKNTQCFTVENKTKGKLYWWYDLGQCNPVPGACFQGAILKSGQSKTFVLNDANSDCSCSTHIFRIWYGGGNNDLLEVHTY